MGKDLVDQLTDAVSSRMQTQGEYTAEVLEEVIDEVVDEFMRDGLITDDEDVQTLKVDVKDRIENLKKESL